MNPGNIVIGNICSLLGMVTDSVSSTRKTAKDVLLIQSASQLIYCIGTVVLKGYSGAVQNVVSILRNLIAIKKIENRAVEWMLVALGVALSVGFNNRGWIGCLPVIANLQYTLSVFRFKDNERALKTSFVVCIGLFAVFNFAIYNFVGMCGNLVVLVTTLIMLFRKK